MTWHKLGHLGVAEGYKIQADLLQENNLYVQLQTV